MTVMHEVKDICGFDDLMNSGAALLRCICVKTVPFHRIDQ
jgi:hypothetical protein